jgi:hypothetical protein
LTNRLGIFKAIAGEIGLMQTPPEEVAKMVDELSARISGKKLLETEGEEIGESPTQQPLTRRSIKVDQGLLNPQLQTKLPGQP